MVRCPGQSEDPFWENVIRVRSYQELTVWQLGVDLVQGVYQATQQFPRSEIHGICSQIQRAAVSVPSNIAEGQQRDSTKEFLRHIAKDLINTSPQPPAPPTRPRARLSGPHRSARWPK
ncbi:MAG TPA: four helix bundle protein [Pirellulales bacterium]|nr:four helix bundle protein [Pirellulales bacterium]